MPGPYRKRAVFIGSMYSPDDPRNPDCLPLSVSEVYKMWALVQSYYPFAAYTQVTAPTRASILGALDAIVAEALPGDAFLFCWSGHGTSAPAAPGDPAEPECA